MFFLFLFVCVGTGIGGAVGDFVQQQKKKNKKKPNRNGSQRWRSETFTHYLLP